MSKALPIAEKLFSSGYLTSADDVPRVALIIEQVTAEDVKKLRIAFDRLSIVLPRIAAGLPAYNLDECVAGVESAIKRLEK